MSTILVRPDSSTRVVGVQTLDPRQVRIQRRATLMLTLLPFGGFALAVRTLWGRGLSKLDLTLFLSTYVFTGLGVTVGFHRYLAHKAFETTRALRNFFAVAGSFSLQGSVISWVGAHRRHHAYTDQPGDPHSPHLQAEEGIRGTIRGLWHAHAGWLFDSEKTDVERWAPDLMKDCAMRKIDSRFPLLAAISLVAPAVIGAAVTRSWYGTVTAFLWGGLARVFMLHHVTWSINSICHYYGRRPLETRDESTNNWPISLVSFGEGWHNNHHAFPSSARHGFDRGQLDATAAVIRMLERLRLVRDVREPSQEQIASKRR